MSETDSHERILSVSQLNSEVRALLEQGYVTVKGELSEVRSSPAWALVYFALKDQNAELPCVMPRVYFERLAVTEGAEVIVKGRLSLYERRGRFQLKADSIEDAGRGTLAAKIEALKKKLEAEGLFASERKRALPTLPTRIGVVSSLSGAAYQDFIKVSAARFGGIHIIAADVHVQGPRAATEIVAALEKFSKIHKQKPIDVIVVTRGGGSLEDLMAFNDEGVAHAVGASPVPVVSAVGHERDVTIIDLVSDARASTPSNAAELVVPDARALLRHVLHLGERANNSALSLLERVRDRLQLITSRPVLTRPHELLRDRYQRVTDVRASLKIVRERLIKEPQRVVGLTKRLSQVSTQLTRSHSDAISTLLGRARALNPKGVLERGYSMTLDATGKVVRDAGVARVNQKLDVVLHRGSLSVKVTKPHGHLHLKKD